MAKPLSPDLRRRVLETVAEGLSYRAAAERFRVSVDSIVEWRKLEREQGHPGRRPMGGDTRSWKIEAERDTVLGILGENPDLTLAELRRALAARGLDFARGPDTELPQAPRHRPAQARAAPQAQTGCPDGLSRRGPRLLASWSDICNPAPCRRAHLPCPSQPDAFTVPVLAAWGPTARLFKSKSWSRFQSASRPPPSRGLKGI